MIQEFNQLEMKDVNRFLKDGYEIYHKTDSLCVLKRFTKVYDTGDLQILETVVTIYTAEDKPTTIYIGWVKNGR